MANNDTHFTLSGFRGLCSLRLSSATPHVEKWADWHKVTCAGCIAKRPKAERICDNNHTNWPMDYPKGWRPGDALVSVSGSIELRTFADSYSVNLDDHQQTELPFALEACCPSDEPTAEELEEMAAQDAYQRRHEACLPERGYPWAN